MNRALRVALWVLVAIAVVAVLFTFVFPKVDRLLNNPTMGAAYAPAA